VIKRAHRRSRDVLSFGRTLWRTHRRLDDQPRLLTYIVTFACNARCIMCDSWKKSPRGDLSLPEIEGIFNQLPRMDAVRLTGGEPFVRKDFPHIADLVRAKLEPHLLHVTTNGFLTEKIVDFCERRDRRLPLFLLISLDGLENKHNQVRGRPWAWQSVKQTLEALAPRQRELKLKIAVNQTIVDAEGARHYPMLRDFLRSLGVGHQMVMAYDQSATYSTDKEIDVAPTEVGGFATFGEFDRAEIEKLLDEVEADTRVLPFFERMAKRYYLRGIRARLLGHGEGSLPNPKCVALSTHMRLYPNGDVPTCQFNSQTVGNLRTMPFAEVWQSDRIKEQRQWVRKCAGCWAECEVLPNAIYSGDLLRQTVRMRADKHGKSVRQRRNLKPGTGSGRDALA
jgi:MoaA/NifB/PqqE/SkfB family radical SAM enzyme